MSPIRKPDSPFCPIQFIISLQYKSIEMLERALLLWCLDYGPQLRTICLAKRWGHSIFDTSNMFAPVKVKVNFICSRRMTPHPFCFIQSKCCKLQRKNKHFQNKSLWGLHKRKPSHHWSVGCLSPGCVNTGHFSESLLRGFSLHRIHLKDIMIIFSPIFEHPG